ncbi:Serine/threonine-protein phosphatase PP2A catalytic subunit [Stylosanthes scabra]|uniref:protein-serine/threonine phosphatase n=1 Tax=Stylosanthes scabra TaxID=79078 RepID=A0ABU6YDE3_9FABA|nr:Serine/threonine-protein phosphatase PP2A catalytic subunit [Stylosanthes scabra]
MALSSSHIQRFLLGNLHGSFSSTSKHYYHHNHRNTFAAVTCTSRSRCYSAIAIDAPSSLADEVPGVRWGSIALQGIREEMEDDIIVRPNGLDGFSFAAVFDGHGGFSSVEFLSANYRDELYKECLEALQGGFLLVEKDFNAIKEALEEAFAKADAKLLKWLEMKGEEDESGATATAVFIGDDTLLISHIGDSSVVLSRAGKAEMLTSPHRPYGSNKASLQEIKRIREAGGWIVNGRICGDIAVSRAFGDVRYKTKKNEMLQKGVQEGRWSQKFISRVRLNNDLVVAYPDIYQVNLDSDTEFIVLASDGLWDYMSSSDAVSFVREQLQKHGNIQLACEALAQAALDRRTQDNVSIIIADLGKTDWQNVSLQQQNMVFELAQALATIAIVSIGIWFSSQLSL